MDEETKEFTNEDSTIYALTKQIEYFGIASNYGGQIYLTNKEHHLLKVYLEKLLSKRKFDEEGYLIEVQLNKKVIDVIKI